MNWRLPGVAAALVTLVVLPTSGRQSPNVGAVLKGHVLDAASGEPLPRILVSYAPDADPRTVVEQLDSRPKGIRAGHQTETGSDGAFQFEDVPAGDYRLSAHDPARVHLVSSYGSVASDRGVLVHVAGATPVTGLTITLLPAARVTGFVRDDQDRPVFGASVTLLRRTALSGTRRLVGTGAVAVTDREGRYSIDSLRPGEYVAVVPSSCYSAPDELPGRGMPPVKSTTKIKHAGTTLWMTGPPLPTSTDDRFWIYPTAFQSGVPSSAQASAFALGAGDARQDADIRLQPVTGVAVSGALVGPASFDGLDVRLIPFWADQLADPGAMAVSVTKPDEHGKFVLNGVPAGSYTVRARLSGNSPYAIPPGNGATAVVADSLVWMLWKDPAWGGALVTAPPTRQPVWSGALALTVGDRDVHDMTVVLDRGVQITGSVQFEGGGHRPEPLELLRMSIRLELATGAEPGAAGDRVPLSGRVEADGSLSLPAVPAGRYFLRVDQPPMHWALNAIIIGGRNVADEPFDLTADMTDATVVLSPRTQTVTGTVRTTSRIADAAASILVFPTDPARWRDFGVTPRNFRVTHVGPTGTFAVGGLPPGEYYLLATSAPDLDDWCDAEWLARLAPLATRVSVGAGGTVACDLVTIAPLPPR